MLCRSLCRDPFHDDEDTGPMVGSILTNPSDVSINSIQIFRSKKSRSS
jgi:hypothetical protein